MLWPIGVSVLGAALILGPALGRGVVLSYDLVWSPERRLTPFATGAGTPTPRAVPSDAVAWLLGWLVTPAVAQKAILFAILVLASLGVVALLRDGRPAAGPMASSVAGLAAVWNPFISERLVVGQWTVLLGYAVLPWALRAAVRVVSGAGGRWTLVLAIAVAGTGGVNSVLMTSAGVVAVLVAGLRRDARRIWISLVASLVVTAGVSAVWALPSLLADAPVARSGVGAFAPAADTPLGVWGSLLSGGGFWNAASHPDPRTTWLVALLAALLSAVAVASFAQEVRGTVQRFLWAPVLVGVLVVVLSALPVTRDLWAWVVTDIPGGGALRDSQKFLAAWVVAIAVGLGVAVDRLRRAVPSAAGLAGLGVAGLVVVLSPQLVWGVGGRLDAQPVPQGYRTAATQLSSMPAGEVGLLPWSQYRRYDWNGGRTSLTLAPRILDQHVLFDDSLPLRSGVVAGENPRAARVSDDIARGAAPVVALRAAGVRYVAAELGAGLDVDQASVRAAGRVLVDDPHLLVVDLGNGTGQRPEDTRWRVVGWLLAGGTLVVSVTGAARSSTRRKLLAGLLRSRA
jgi:hypothetical protein